MSELQARLSSEYQAVEEGDAEAARVGFVLVRFSVKKITSPPVFLFPVFLSCFTERVGVPTGKRPGCFRV